ncbi:Inner membrane magnesium transporter MRS2 [Malassezia yamatoensis]|uniref:Magnesium transporter n=1 Tax=Malassezia yamatoensis TaxID=253288 RepID=A0AAJ5YW00_9BASI|nr:Inner membrane magnesium transporter MRS2 [Malassezia yamatoensis]
MNLWPSCRSRLPGTIATARLARASANTLFFRYPNYNSMRGYGTKDTEPPFNKECHPYDSGLESNPSFDENTLSSSGQSQFSPNILLRCTILDSKGQVKSISGLFRKLDLCSHHGLEARDLRKIDSRVPNLVPTILARRSGILINILHIRAMIKSDAVLLFDSYGTNDTSLNSAFIYNLGHNLRQTSSNLPYEFRALESIFASVLDALRSELSWLRLVVDDVLEMLEEDIDREKLRMLLQITRKLHGFLSRARSIKQAIAEVLDNDEDMALMYLTAAKDGHPMTEQSKMEELELLLESFEKQIEEVVAEVDGMYANANNTQEIAELMLDSSRNRLLTMELRIGIVALGFTIATFIAGLFGMNLISGFEDHPYAFYVATAVAAVVALVVSVNGTYHLAKVRRVSLSVNNHSSSAWESFQKPEATSITHARAWWWREKQFHSQRRAQARKSMQEHPSSATNSPEQAMASVSEQPLDPAELSTSPSRLDEPMPAASMESDKDIDQDRQNDARANPEFQDKKS